MRENDHRNNKVSFIRFFPIPKIDPLFRSEQYAEEISTEEIQVVSEENLHEKMYNPWKDNYEPQNRERTESGYSSGSFAPYAAPEGGAPYTPFEQYDSNSAIYSPSVQLRFYFPRQESNGSPSVNPEIKTPLVANFSKQLPAETSPLAAF